MRLSTRFSLQSRPSSERRSSREGTRAWFLAVAMFLLGEALVQAAYFPPGAAQARQSSPTWSTPTVSVVPASVVVSSQPDAMIQLPGRGGATTKYTLTNVGEFPTTITLAQQGAFFSQTPSSFVLQPSGNQTVTISAFAEAPGNYVGASIPSGDGVPLGTSIPIRLAVVASPAVNGFTANPSTITAGQSSALSWTTTNTTTVSISGVTGTQSANGSVSVSPTATTSYTLTATGPGGMSTAMTTIVVNPAPASCQHSDWSDLQLPTSEAGRQLELYFGRIPSSHPTLYKPMIDDVLDDRVQALAAQSDKQKISIVRVSGFRPPDYQTHLYRLKVLYKGIYDARKSEPNIAVTCADEIEQVMREVLNHELTHKTVMGVELPGELLVGMTSRHSDLPANALDVSVSPQSGLKAVKAALPANRLHAPCHEAFLHLQTVPKCVGSTTITAAAFVPAGVGMLTVSSVPLVPLRLLISDPAGRRVGYDAATGVVVNEIGEKASYSGIDSDPQVVTIDDAVDGDYRLEAVAVSSGDYMLALTADDTDDSTNVASTSRTGHALAGDRLEPLGLNLENTVPEPPGRGHAARH
ncbi:MAG TPA: hypothetical protein VHL58_19035 [Thermoanaerobaculia bacterium]|nr:hypothetical protein [Thermoanaerobaculia bacterium]